MRRNLLTLLLGGGAEHPMRRLLSLLLAVSASFVACMASAGHPPFFPVQCVSDTGDSAVAVTDRRHTPGLRGSVRTATGDIFSVGPLRFREAGPNLIWRGKAFLLRVATHQPTAPGEFSGFFRGRDDDGNPVILSNLSCTLFF